MFCTVKKKFANGIYLFHLDLSEKRGVHNTLALIEGRYEQNCWIRK